MGFNILKSPIFRAAVSRALLASSVVGMSACAVMSNTQTDNAATAPYNVAYSKSPAIYEYGITIAPNKISYSGEVATRFSISPETLPDGLVFDTTTGTISGTPTTITAAVDYVINVFNARGSGYVLLHLGVGDHLPTISYGGLTTRVFTVGSAIAAITPTLAGGATTSCSSSPALPPGLAISSSCVISGTPTAAVAARNYVITASNSGGSASLTFSFTVNDVAPAISYGGSFNLTRGVAASKTVTNTGGAVVSCAVAPALPAGLALASDCAITGTPSALSGSTSYTFTATNSGGTSTDTLNIAVIDVVPAISYSPGTVAYTRLTAITAASPANTGGVIVSCSSSPALPAGLSISNSCVITGTPTALSASTPYTITATNSAGSGATTLNIAVNDIPPALSYPAGAKVYTINNAIPALNPTNGGGPITGCTSSPALPAGIALSSTCVISGTPTGTQAATNHVITATNSGGSSSATVNITVNNVTPALSYAGSPYTFTQGTSVGTIIPSNTGGAPTSCTSSPALPAGLALSSACAISGTPTAGAAASPYTITAANSAGSANVTISIAVTAVTPPNLSFSPTFAYAFTRGAAIAAVTPSNTGGAIASCSSSPALPAGLSISNTTCSITGTPSIVHATTDYVITATNGGGSSAQTLTITVNDTLPAISYAGSPFTYLINNAITTLTPANSGGAIVSCSSSPALPAGLSLSASCVISGTPTVVAAPAVYTISATNSAGTASTGINIRVNDVAPAITLSGASFSYPVGSAIAPITATNTGGAITGCSSSPALPAGLSVNATTCAVSGTPTATAGATSYTITATNSGGSSARSVTITVTGTPPAIDYLPTSYNFVYTRGVAIATLSPNSTGGAISSCAVSPALPAGLSFNTSTCAITGTPSALRAAASYSVTASNAAGSDTEVITITVNDAAPSLSYAGGPFAYTVNSAISTVTPANSGGAVVSCSVSPALPSGLSISNLCAISGTPTVVTADQAYSITATNSGGSGSVVIHIAINDIAPMISFAGGPYVYTRTQAITTLTPSSTGGAVTSCSSSPALPAGLSLSSGCVLSGTPTALAAAASYTITATNSGGNDPHPITITVNDVPPSIGFSPASVVYVLRTTISSAVPSNTGGAITGCGVSPSLPTGLALSSSDCSISGTPTAISANASYTVTATNTGGSASATISIQVKNRPQIVFESLTAVNGAMNGTASGSKNIWKFSDDGVDTLKLTQNTSTGLDSAGACFAPSGAQVIYESKRASNGSTNGTAPLSANLWKTAADASSSSALTANTLPSLDSDQAPVFSPDGTKIAFASKTATSGSDNGSSSSSYNIFVENINGTGRIALTQNTFFSGRDSIQPSFSPDSAYVYFASKTNLGGGWNGAANANYNIWKVKTDGTGLTALTTTNSAGKDSNNPVVSPDNTQVAFESRMNVGASASSSFNIFLMNTDGSGQTALTTQTAAGQDSQSPHYSPDGTEIVFASKMNVNAATALSFNIWKMASNGTSQVALTTHNASALDSLMPHFSPDNLQIVFQSRMNVGISSSSSFNIWVMKEDGTGKTALTTNTNAGLDSQLGPGEVWYKP